MHDWVEYGWWWCNVLCGWIWEMTLTLAKPSTWCAWTKTEYQAINLGCQVGLHGLWWAETCTQVANVLNRWQQHGREINKKLHVKNNLVDALATWKGSKESKQLYYCLKFVQQIYRGKQSMLWQFSHSIFEAAEGENSMCYVGKQCIMCVCMSL